VFIKKANRIEHNKLILNSHNKVKTTWGIINKESGGNKRSEIQALNVEGGKITDQQTIAETFNEYSVAIAENAKRQSKNNLINDDNSSIDIHTYFMEQAFNKPYPSMECKCTRTKDIEQIIKSLKTKNSYGYNEILTKILKIINNFICFPLNYVCNKILLWGVFPDGLKYAVIKPLHKNGDRCEVSNYRPASLLTSFSKIFGMVMQTRILKTPHQI
jgi:hypothetical protein